MARQENRYKRILERIFFDKYQDGLAVIPFERQEMLDVCQELGFTAPKNIGDAVYATRYRKGMPKSLLDHPPKGKEWIILGVGRGLYNFRLVKESRIRPQPSLLTIKIPDSTPEIINMYAQSDEQALLAVVRYRG
ncbi:hypothetical protein ICN86_15180 [Aquisalinus flavus]|uniref:hypothetical protein n=1 Tax=Aquisalinus flavus TaxID=1526572 RepID=UPI00165FC110|nr:hypothetical protein [Aquisalinus flavus]MBD0428165.1 hypothetical protein [Aquisalinus flavus]